MSAVAHIDEYKTGKYYQEAYRGSLSWNGYEHNVLLHNLGNDERGVPHFVEVGKALGVDDQADSRGIAVADYDNDGDLDIVVNHNPGDRGKQEGIAPSLWRNDLATSNHYLAIELEGTSSNRDAIGAEITVATKKTRQVRVVTAGSSYASQHSSRQHIGLGDETHVERITVRWPGGKTETYENQPADRILYITEGKGIIKRSGEEPLKTTGSPR